MTYSIVDFPEDNQRFGEFDAKTPKKAAHQAFDYLSNISNLKSKFGVYIVFTVVDNNTQKDYNYIGSRVKLENPVIRMEKGEKKMYHYKNVIGRFSSELKKIRTKS
jgi:hypothetical protein